ncbi:MAG: metalloregulator ArsR/SmtB family transcription factor [Bacteroidia bacterium]|nr:metalloregulator ArsR/SmtB family transcription factor [Bacteroidia bacterium]
MSIAQAEWTISQMESLSRKLKAIAHPVRLAIIEMLEGDRRMTVTEIYTRLNADQSSISHHLSILRDKRVLSSERKGKFIYYFLRNQSYLSLIDCLSEIHKEDIKGINSFH